MGVVLLAMTIGGLIIAAILLIISRFAKLNWLKTFVLGGIATWLAGYLILLFVGSIFSEEKTLALNEPKEFCGFYFDCHLHTAVTNVRKTKTVGDKTANGEFYVVTVKVSSDAKQAPLNLITPGFAVVDADGRHFERDASLEKPEPNWEQKVPAGGSFEKEVVFDLPVNVQNPRLDIREGYGIDHAIEAILIGDEDSILHKRNYFKLEQQTQIVSVK